MKPRALLLVLLLAAITAGAFLARSGEHWSNAEAWCLDFLLAATRERFERDPVNPPDNVVFIAFNEKDKAEFSAWPPAPIDYIMVLRKLKGHDPDVVAFTDVLEWKTPGVQFVDQLQQSLVALPQVALAFRAVTGATAESGLVSEDRDVPSFARVDGDSSAAPRLSRLHFPDARLSTQMQLGFVATEADQPAKTPPLLVGRADDRLVPSLAAQMIALQSHAPYVSQRIRFGLGAGLHLGTERFIPLTQDGIASPKLNGAVTRVNALDLLTPELGDGNSKAVSELLGRNKLVILGISPSPGEAHATLAAWALALPKLHDAPAWVPWLAAGLAALAAFGLLRFRRFGVIIVGACALASLLGVWLSMFQTSLTWWPPLLPAALLLAGTVFCFLWPRKA